MLSGWFDEQRGKAQRQLLARLQAVLAVALATWAMVGFGAVRPIWSFAATLVILAWAAFWPMSSPNHAESGGAVAPPSTSPDPHAATAEPAPDMAQLAGLLLQGIPDAAMLIDGNGTVLAGNRAAHDIMPEATGRHFTAMTRQPELIESISAAIATGEMQTCRIRIAVPVERHFDARVTPFGPSTSRPAGQAAMLIVLRDLTEQDRLSRMRADFVAHASHELRTPLASLKGFVETLIGAARDDPVARERFLGIMQEQADRMSRLIDDLLSLSRIEMRQHVPPRDLVDLSEISHHVVQTLEPVALKASVAIRTEIPNAPVVILGDRDELIQAIQNLLQNAIKYGREGGVARLAIEREQDRVKLSVTDDGVGIADEHLPRLTERFYRVSASESRRRGGTGLGLAIVKHIVNRHRGDLEITSQLGVGSTFALVFRVPKNIYKSNI